MPAHAAPLPKKVASPPSDHQPSASALPSDQTYFSGSSSPHGEGLQTVPEEPSSTESSRVIDNDGAEDVYSPPPIGPSVATLEAEISGHATASGKPLFVEPEFGSSPDIETAEDTEPAAPDVLGRSPSSFLALTVKESETVSPTER